MSKLLFAIIFLSTLICCKQKNNSQEKFKSQTNDTVLILKSILDTNFLLRSLPDYSSVFGGRKSNDTIFCVFDSTFPKSYIPKKFTNSYMKICAKDSICKIIESSSQSSEPPNYLNINSIEKKDSIFYIQISSLSCLKYGGGGSVGIYIAKRNNIFVIKETLSSSIN